MANLKIPIEIQEKANQAIADFNLKTSFTNWEFAIYRFTKDNYFPMEYLFPGYDCVDGTIEGAMKAGNKAYPPRWTPADANITTFFKHLFGK